MAWLAGYSKRKAITITGGASGAQTDFQLKLTVTYDGDMQSDFDDLRFTQADGETLIDAWLETKTDDASATVWAEFPTTPANTVEQTYYMYYGNAGAASDWDGDGTFQFFDDCSGSVVSDKYDTAGGLSTGSFSYSGGEMITTYDSIAGGKILPIKDTYSISNDCVMECDLKVESGASSEYLGIVMRWIDNGNHYQMYSHDTGKSYILDKSDDAYTEVATGIAVDTWYESKGIVKGSDLEWYPTGSLIVERTDATHSTGRVGLFSYRGITHWDDIRVRKYAANPPTYAFGAEESAPTGAAPTSIFYGPFGGPFGGPI